MRRGVLVVALLVLNAIDLQGSGRKLGMIREGFIRVRMEIIPEQPAPNALDANPIAAH